MNRTILIIRYTGFALVATIVNLAAQRLVMGAAPPTFRFELALVTGTFAGLAVKYLLDQSDTRKKIRFVEEAQITGQLEHPNIVPIHELGVDADKRIFLASL